MAGTRKVTPGLYLLDPKLLRERIADPGRHPYTLPVLGGLSTLAFHPKVTFLVGESGTGKSTLLEAVAVARGLNPEGGSRNFAFATRASHSALGGCFRLARPPSSPRDSYFPRAESFDNVASETERLDRDGGRAPIIHAYGGRSLHGRSHGESFLALFGNRLGDNGLYLMGEPEAALPPTRQIQFPGLRHDDVRDGSQFLIATHPPIILAYPEATLDPLDGGGIREVASAGTGHDLVTRGFLANPARTQSALFEGAG